MEQQVWSLPRARRSTLRPRVAVLSPHTAFQGHAAHTARWPAMLSPNGSSGTCMPDGVDHIPMPCFTAQPSLFSCPSEARVMYLQRAGKYKKPAWRLSQEQKDLDERPLRASQ